MGLFDFLFGKKIDKKNSNFHQETAANTLTTKMSQTVTSPHTQSSPVYNHTTSQKQNDIVVLAQQFNFAHNTGSSSAGQLSSILYSEVGPRKQGGQALIRLSAEECQSVGLAFTAIALCYNFGDKDINSVAAENAFYCLSRNLIEKGNSFVAPAIFTLMQKGSELMRDKLIASWCEMAQKQVGMPIGMMLGGNPFTDPRLEDFREQAINFRNDIAYHCLLKFYDLDKQEYKIPTDMPYFIPTKSEIDSLILRVKENSSFGLESYFNSCEEHFTSVYNECKDTLMKY